MPTEPQPQSPTGTGEQADTFGVAVAAVVAEVLHLADQDPGPAPRRPPQALAGFCTAALRRVSPTELAMADSGRVAAELLHDYDALDALPPREAAVEIRPAAPSWFGPEGGRTSVAIVARDRPLLFSTAVAALGAAGLHVLRSSHPILGVERGPDGRITSVGRPTGEEGAEVLIHVEVAQELDTATATSLGQDLVDAIGRAVQADRDGAAMRSVLAVAADRLLGDVAPLEGREDPPYDAAERAEVAGFCRWLLGRNFLFLGLERDHDGTHLGICGDEERAEELTPPVHTASRRFADTPLIVRRSTTTSPVARRERLAEILLADVDPRGVLAGTIRILGLTTLRGRSERPSGVPWLRTRLRAALAMEQVVPGSHDETVMTALFDDLPWDVLLMADPAWMQQALVELLSARQFSRAAVLVLPETGSSAFTVVIGHPADHDRPGLREAVTAYLCERYRPEALEVQAELGSSGMTMLSVVVALPPERRTAPDVSALVTELGELSRSWTDLLAGEVGSRMGAAGPSVAARWLPRLPPSYRAATDPAAAAADLEQLEEVAGTGGLRVSVGEPVTADGAGEVHVRLVVDGPPPELSRLVPVLESTGLRISEDMTFALGPAGTETVDASVLDLTVRAPELRDGDAGRLSAAVLACWEGSADVDALNELVLSAGLTWDQVAVLRAYTRYLGQLRPGTTSSATEAALVDNPEVAVALWRRFERRFAGTEPSGAEPVPAEGAAWDEEGRAQVLSCCDDVARLDQDRLLRDLGALLDATVRTNFFSHGRSGATTLAFDGAHLPGDSGGTWRELWVTGPAVEGIHLRAGPVARGGLRWSDRTGDLRTEVHQLMRAQVLKNALIVPTGAKGGFVLRNRPSDPASLQESLRDAYATFVTSMLDVVDDRRDGEVVHPDGVRAADDEDSYLVVAADRGTATFSDLANGIATGRGYWLGDAFASGGSTGYDHKALGVTARGAWAAVAEHFERLGVDVASDSFTAVGVGDMSGDVFGNGMLLSRSIRLVAAFDHRHVFLDPDPDPGLATAERRRLFHLPRSSWDDYDRDALSAGGKVVSRSAKSVALDRRVGQVLGIDEGELSMPALLRAVLGAPVDLLYFAGIGTFVRARSESDASIGDSANEEIRVTADQVRAKVVVEGANLAITPRGRVELAAAGTLLNGDFVDNSAGVDSSDREVNLKILLNVAEVAGRVDDRGREELLGGAAPEVVDAVVGSVAKQVRALTRAERRSAEDLEPFLTLMYSLEAEGRISGEVHALPGGTELRRRQESRRGLLRPELAVLMAATKGSLAEVALDSGLAARPELAVLASQALPASVAGRLDDLLAKHPLQREMVASRLANEVVDRMGMTWVDETARRAVAPAATVLAAYWMARETAGLGRWWNALDDVALEDRDRIWDPAVEVTDALTADYLRRGVAAAWGWEEVDRAIAAARVLSHPGPLGGDPSMLRRLAMATGLADVARRADLPPAEVLDAFLEAGERFGLDRISWALLGARVDPADPWAQRHRDSLLFDVDRMRRAAALVLLDAERRRRADVRLEGLPERIQEALDADRPGLDPLAVAVAELWLVVEDLAGEVPRI